jgi:hypothetical protein
VLGAKWPVLGFLSAHGGSGPVFVVGTAPAGYIWTMSKLAHHRSIGRRVDRRIVLDDHERLPARFFGRLTASVQAQL